MNNNAIGRLLTSLRAYKGLSQVKVAELTGIPQATVCRAEQGTHRAAYTTIRTLVGAYGVDIGRFDAAATAMGSTPAAADKAARALVDEAASPAAVS